MYAITYTRPDIAFAVRKLNRYASNLSNLHQHAICRVLKYLKKTINYGILYSRYSSILEEYMDTN